MDKIKQLTDYLASLRHGDKQCDWTASQTFETLAPQTLEEAYELLEALQSGDTDQIKSELSDMLYHVLFYAQIAAEQGLFTLDDLAAITLEKHQQRMPTNHGGLSAEDINAHWQAQKAKRRASGDLFEGVTMTLPSLMLAEQAQTRAATVGFDWDQMPPVIAKLEEEIAEFKAAVADGDKAAQAHELGDMIQCCVNIARHADLNAEVATRQAVQRFMQRLQSMQASAAEDGKTLNDYELDALEALWQQAKREKS
jgi:nucleoside triphosphate diphosphatase